jgi:hypothetical protein
MQAFSCPHGILLATLRPLGLSHSHLGPGGCNVSWTHQPLWTFTEDSSQNGLSNALCAHSPRVPVWLCKNQYPLQPSSAFLSSLPSCFSTLLLSGWARPHHGPCPAVPWLGLPWKPVSANGSPPHPWSHLLHEAHGTCRSFPSHPGAVDALTSSSFLWWLPCSDTVAANSFTTFHWVGHSPSVAVSSLWPLSYKE